MGWQWDQVLENAPLKPSVIYRYVNDTFLIWPHVRDSLNEFLEFVKHIHANIKCTREAQFSSHQHNQPCPLDKKWKMKALSTQQGFLSTAVSGKTGRLLKMAN